MSADRRLGDVKPTTVSKEYLSLASLGCGMDLKGEIHWLAVALT